MSNQFSLPGFDAPPSPRRPIKAPHARSARHGLFFGLLPSPAELLRVEAVAAPSRKQYGMRRGPVIAKRLHITCCDLGNFIDEPAHGLVEAAMQVAAGLVLPSFEIVFSHVMRFRGNEALVLLEHKGVTPLTVFRDALGEALVQAELPVDFGATPHMTLAYGSDEVSEALVDPIRWVVQDFVLVHSLIGQGEHRHLGRWPLMPRP
jgi:2'-5' RNA ligase